MAFDPANLTVAITGTTADLSWDASGTANVQDYSVFRRTPQTGAAFDPNSDSPIASGLTATTYSDTGLTLGNGYDWQVFGRIEAVWSPLDLPGLVGWWDAADTATIAQAGGSVSQWDDKSGNARHLLQGVAGRQPTTGTRTINGRNVLDFAAADDFMAITSGFAYPSVNTFTLVAVVLVDSATNERIISLSSATGQDDYDGANESAMLSTDGTNHYHYMNNGDRGHAARVIGSAVQLTVQRNGDSASFWKNGSAGTGGTGCGTTNFSGNVFSIGGRSSGAGMTPEYDGVVAEVILDSTALGTTDREAAEAYLKAKWGTP